MNSLSLLDDLKKTIDCRILENEADLRIYGTDWTREYDPDPLAVVFPESTQDVQKIVFFANKHNTPIVPSGGRTGLSGGAVASEKEIVVSLESMNRITGFNETDRLLYVESGVTTLQVQEYAEIHNLFYPIDLASKGSSHIGGNIATNAGGLHVIRYGSTRNWVKGLKVVTGSGHILNLNKGLTKNATGYDLMNLFIGSEGTLGIICEAVIGLTDTPPESVNMLLSVTNISKSIELLNSFRSSFKLNAFEFFSESAVKHINRISKARLPLGYCPYYLLIDFECETDKELEKAENIYTSSVKKGLIKDGVISQNRKQYKDLWDFRENITESISKYLTYKNDISVKPSLIPEFVKDISYTLTDKYPDFDTILFGHIGDGNIHISILKPDDFNKNKFLNICREVNNHIYKTVAKYEGSISAEHGVGIIKRPYLMYTRTAKEIEIMKNIKNIFDPNNILNPGKIFPS